MTIQTVSNEILKFLVKTTYCIVWYNKLYWVLISSTWYTIFCQIKILSFRGRLWGTWERQTRWTWWPPERRYTPRGGRQIDNRQGSVLFTRRLCQVHPRQEAEAFSAYACCKSRKEPWKDSSATVAELKTAINAVSAAALAISELTAATTKHAAAECGESIDSDLIAEPKVRP
jgi:hypothetical protein